MSYKSNTSWEKASTPHLSSRITTSQHLFTGKQASTALYPKQKTYTQILWKDEQFSSTPPDSGVLPGLIRSIFLHSRGQALPPLQARLTLDRSVKVFRHQGYRRPYSLAHLQQVPWALVFEATAAVPALSWK